MNYGSPQLIKFKNNWTGDSKENIKYFDYIKEKGEDIKSKTANLIITANNKLSKEEIPSKDKVDKHKASPHKSQLISQRNQGIYRRINKDFCKDKLKDEKIKKANNLITFSPNCQKATTIYENVKMHYDGMREAERKYSKSVLRN